LGTVLKDGEGIISKILKRELESRESEAGKMWVFFPCRNYPAGSPVAASTMCLRLVESLQSSWGVKSLKSLKAANLNCEYLSPVVATLQAHQLTRCRLNDIASAGGLIAHVIKRQQLDELDWEHFDDIFRLEWRYDFFTINPVHHTRSFNWVVDQSMQYDTHGVHFVLLRDLSSSCYENAKKRPFDVSLSLCLLLRNLR
jgi:hypothetical protein